MSQRHFEPEPSCQLGCAPCEVGCAIRAPQHQLCARQGLVAERSIYREPGQVRLTVGTDKLLPAAVRLADLEKCLGERPARYPSQRTSGGRAGTQRTLAE